MDMKLVDMKREEEKEPEEVAMSGSMSPYPYGLCIHLDKDEMDKLGITELPSVGMEYHIFAVGQVNSVSQSASDYGQGEDESSSMGIQITMLQLVPEPPHAGEEKETPAIESKEVIVKGKVRPPMTAIG